MFTALQYDKQYHWAPLSQASHCCAVTFLMLLAKVRKASFSEHFSVYLWNVYHSQMCIAYKADCKQISPSIS